MRIPSLLAAAGAIFCSGGLFAQPFLSSPYFNVRNHGAKGDGRADDTAAIQHTIDSVTQRGGGIVYVPPGRYNTRPFQLKNGVTFYLEANATLVASPRIADYPVEPKGRFSESQRAGLITIRNANKVAITGRGVIEGSGLQFVDRTKVKILRDADRKLTRQGDDFMDPRFGANDGPWMPLPERPGNLIRIVDSEDVEITGVTIRNAPTWTIEIFNSVHINIHAARILASDSQWRVPNDDGIDIRDSRLVHISDMDIESGDDCIAVFSGEDITVTNSTLRSKSAGIRIGYFEGALRRAVFSNLVIHDSNRGVNVNVRYGNTIENVLFSNIVIHTRLFDGQWWGKAEPVNVSALLSPRGTGMAGFIRDLRFEHISAESEAGIVVFSEPAGLIRDLFFDDVRVRIRKGPLQESYGGNFDLRGDTPPEFALFKHDIPAFYARGVTGLTINDVNVQWEDGVPEFYTNALYVENSSIVDIQHLKGKSARNGVPVLRIENSKEVTTDFKPEPKPRPN